ncbi:MAG: hypothetical protein ACO1OB_29095 [Archangium sp.]
MGVSVRIVAVVCLWAASAWARCPPREFPPVVPQPGARIPANTLLFAGSGERGLTRVNSDGTSLALERSDAGGYAPYFLPGELAAGDTFFLNDGGTPVTVGPAAPFPTKTGTIAIGPPHWADPSCGFAEPSQRVERDVFVQLAPEVVPWRDVASIAHVRGGYRTGLEPVSSFIASGVLAQSPQEPGLGTFVGVINYDCDRITGPTDIVVDAKVFIAGAPVSAEIAEQRVTVDCAQLPPRECSVSPSVALISLATLLIRSSSTARRRRADLQQSAKS